MSDGNKVTVVCSATAVRCVPEQEGVQHATQGHFGSNSSSSRAYLKLMDTQRGPSLLLQRHAPPLSSLSRWSLKWVHVSTYTSYLAASYSQASNLLQWQCLRAAVPAPNSSTSALQNAHVCIQKQEAGATFSSSPICNYCFSSVNSEVFGSLHLISSVSIIADHFSYAEIKNAALA